MHISEKVFQTVCDYYGVNLDRANSRLKDQELVLCRQMTHYLLSQHTGLGLAEIGARVANRDRTTVIHSIGVINARSDNEKKLRSDLEILNKILSPVFQDHENRPLNVEFDLLIQVKDLKERVESLERIMRAEGTLF